MTLEELLTEDLPLAKFYYSRYKHNKYPEVIVFDAKYPGIKGQKSFGEREDVLGWNLNYYINKKEAIESINDINDFASLLTDDGQERYRRIKKFFPEQASLIRRYIKKHIKHTRFKGKNGLWEKGEL